MVHKPVLLKQVLEFLDLRPGQAVLDCTVGAAGHAVEMLKAVSPGGFLTGLDRDPEVAAHAVATLTEAGFVRGKHFDVEIGRFSQFDPAQATRPVSGFDRVLADLGVNSLHLDRPDRGFSFKRDGPLDMRMNPQESGSPSAADVIASQDEKTLRMIFESFGEERFAGRIARTIVKARDESPILTTGRLRELVERSIPRRAWPEHIDPSTRVFQALRIYVNHELDELDGLLEVLPDLLVPGGRAGIISFHSLEDRRVKKRFRMLSRACTCPPELPVCVCGAVQRFRLVAPRGVVADETEINDNPRARSARLRVVEKLAV